jgi:hypothetical protein
MEKDKFGKESHGICRALISSSETEEYDFDCVAVPSDNRQLKYSYQNEEYFWQVLRTGQENINTERLELGLPLFDNHEYEKSAENTKGITVGYEFTERGLVVRCKHGARADEALKSDIKNKIIRSVSIEGDVEMYSIERQAGQVPVYYAEKWTPTSLSYAPVPQDISAQIDVKRALARQIEKSNTKPSFFNSLTKNIKK